MTKEEKFKGFDFSMNPYEDEIRQCFGNQKVEKTNASIQKMNKLERHTIEERFNTIFIL